MLLKLLFMPLYNTVESIFDTCRDSVWPVEGSVVYCDLAFGYMDHSGIYIGNKKIVHLSGKGNIEIVSPKQFISGSTARNIYVSCKETESVGSADVARRAKEMVGASRNYNFLLDNCHQFSAGCLTGYFENSCGFLVTLKAESAKNIGSNSWRHSSIKIFE